jgi:putative transcriptional regulator
MDTSEVPDMPARQVRPLRTIRHRNGVADARRSAGLTQPELAAKVGASRPTIARVEAGKQVASVILALRLAQALDTTVETLFGGGER